MKYFFLIALVSCSSVPDAHDPAKKALMSRTEQYVECYSSLWPPNTPADPYEFIGNIAVNKEGKIIKTKITQKNFENRDFEKCIIREWNLISFPPAVLESIPAGGELDITETFRFNRGIK